MKIEKAQVICKHRWQFYTVTHQRGVAQGYLSTSGFDLREWTEEKARCTKCFAVKKFSSE